MDALVQTPPKPHDEIKLGRRASDVSQGATIIAVFDGDHFTSGYRLFPDGKRSELSREELGNPKKTV